MAEGCHSTVVIGTDPLAGKIREPVNQYFGAGLFLIGKEEILGCVEKVYGGDEE